MQKIVFLIIGLLLAQPGFTQTDKSTSLTECYQWAEKAYPLGDKIPLLERAQALRIEQIRAERMPSLDANFLASWQTEVPHFPDGFPAAIGDLLNLPLYKTQLSVQAGYLIYDGGLTKARVAQEETSLAAEKQGVAVELNKLKETVNQYFFGILLLQEKERILQTSLETLRTQQQRIDAGIRNGVVLPSAADQLEVEVLKLQAQIAETQLTETGLRQQLAELTGKAPEEMGTLDLPEFPDATFPLPLNRPEFVWLDLQKESIAQREDLLHAARMPKVSAFATGGLGYPNPLNFFDDGLAPYAQVGVQAKWTIYDWGKQKRDRELLGVQSLLLDNQRTVLETNLNRADANFLQQIQSLEQLMESDRQIADLQAKLLKTIGVQMENGVATITDYVLQTNAETLARMQLKSHEVQLAQVKAGYWVHRGSF
ncbi:MAG: TolC family protein [Saprospirales bacterium]|nr:TolC family protein [Saprospirales bacterium]